MKIRKLDNKALSGAAAAVIIVFLLIASIGGTVGYLVYTKQLSLGGTGNNQTTGVPKGTYTIESYAFDSLVSGTARVIATDIFVRYYTQIGGVWQQLGTAAAATVGSIVLTGAENGYIYAIVTTITTAYLDVAQTTQMNSLLTYVGYQNVLGNSQLPQYVFKINVNGITPGLRLTPDINLNWYCYLYTAFTLTGASGNQTGVGTALNTTYLGWYMTAPAVGEGIAVKQITLATNDTNPSTQTLYKQNIPAVGFLNGGSLTVNPQASAIVYTWNAQANPLTGAVDLGSTIPWALSSVSVNKFDLTTAIQTTFPAGSYNETWTITVYWLTPAGIGASASLPMSLHS